MLRQIYNQYFSSEKEFILKIKPIIGFTPSHPDLFKLAFFHKSMQIEANLKNSYNNERLEYLGDAILSTIVAEYLFKKYPHKDEGFLTKMRSRIVKRNSLNDIADKMGLDMILADYTVGKMSDSMLGNALEALVGAIYIEFGYDKTSTYVIKNILMRYVDIHALEDLDDNYKSILLEWSQKNGKDIEFKVINKSKHDKRDFFNVGVFLEGSEIAAGEDFNKKAAEQKAASSALEALGI
jgi:ribonuclease III